MSEALRKTPLTEWHASHGARMVPFAGFDMPVQYPAGIQEEVRIVRNESGLFDLCHMGRLVLRGPDRVKATDRVVSKSVEKIPLDAIRYGLICNPEGTVIDDVLVYRGADEIHVVINASGRETDPAWFAEKTAGMEVEIDDVSDKQAMLALQGPLSKEILPKVCDADLDVIKYYRFGHGKLLGSIDALVSRTGYTGEDGFELFFAPEQAQRVWDALVEAGAKPIGLGARDVCRTEAGMPLYGHEMNLEITPLEACLDFGVDLDKDFIGADALREQKAAGLARTQIGLLVEGKRVPRDGCRLLHEGNDVGFVTSGTYSPTLGRPIAMALVRTDLAREGLDMQVDVRGKPVPVKVDGLPFYSRKRKKKAPTGGKN